MSEKVDLTEVIALSDKLAIAQERVIVSLDGVSQSIDTVNTMESFSGTAAISAKEYFTDFHQIMIAAFQELFLEIHNTLKRHINIFLSTVDASEVARINSSYIEYQKEAINRSFHTFDQVASDINKTIIDVSDLVPIGTLQISDVSSSKNESIRVIQNLMSNYHTFMNVGKSVHTNEIEAHTQSMNNILSDIRQKTSSIQSFNIEEVKSLDSFHMIHNFINKGNQKRKLKLYSGAIETLSLFEIEKAKNAEIGKLNDYDRKTLNNAFEDLRKGKINKKEYLLILKNIGKFEREIEYGSNNLRTTDNLLKYISNDTKNKGDKSGIVNKSDSLKNGYYGSGDRVNVTDNFTVTGGVGYFEHDYDWSNPISDGKLGGTSSVSLINTGMELDSYVADAYLDSDVLKGSFTAQVGGKSLYGLNLPMPLFKGEATAYELGSGIQFDEDIPVLGRLGAEAKGKAGNAKAYAGVEKQSVGIAAKASMVEAEGAVIAPIPFTEHEVKFILGASAGSIGGEAKVGKTIMLDLRVIFGLKLGIEFQ